jgi:hypothetical protein
MKVRLLVLCLVTGLVGFVAPGHASATQGGQCKKVDAKGVGQDLGGGNTAATITNDGHLKGSTTAHFDIVGGAPPVFQIDGVVTFTTNKGTLTVGVAGTFDVSTGAFNASGPVTGGTGRFAGSSGSLAFDGVQNLLTGAFAETVEGTVCLDKGSDS